MRVYPGLFTMDDLVAAFHWIIDLRKDYSANSDIWNLRARWKFIKDGLLARLNDGTYPFDLLDRYEFDDAIITLWSSQDMIALKLIALALRQRLGNHISRSCYHIAGHGGLKKAVSHTHEALSEYKFVMRSDIKGYYESTRFDVLHGDYRILY